MRVDPKIIYYDDFTKEKSLNSNWKPFTGPGKLGKNICRSSNVQLKNDGLHVIGSYDPKVNKYVGVSIDGRSITMHPGEYCEATIKLPSISKGVKTSFWLLANHNIPNDNTEFDVFECGDEGNVINQIDNSIHLNPNHQVKSAGRTVTFDKNYSNQFHTFGLDWENDYIATYIDGKLFNLCTGNIPTDTTVGPIIDLDLDIPNWTGEPNKSELPTDMIVKDFKLFKTK